jgi:hypothetical protein
MGERHGRPPCLSTDGFYLKSERHFLDSNLRFAQVMKARSAQRRLSMECRHPLCHPERTRISYFTALTGAHLCGSL